MVLDIPHVETDALFHGPNWTRRDEFVADVVDAVASDRWVMEWQYAEARDIIADACDLLVWLDLPFWRSTLPRVVRRTIHRALTHEVLWNGNREQPLWSFLRDRDHIVRWAIRTRRDTAVLVASSRSSRPGLRVVRLRSRSEVEIWVAGLLRA